MRNTLRFLGFALSISNQDLDQGWVTLCKQEAGEFWVVFCWILFNYSACCCCWRCSCCLSYVRLIYRFSSIFLFEFNLQVCVPVAWLQEFLTDLSSLGNASFRDPFSFTEKIGLKFSWSYSQMQALQQPQRSRFVLGVL